MTRSPDRALVELAERVLNGVGCDNALDVEIECALFEADGEFVSARPNNASTKVIFTRTDGTEATFWAEEWTRHRPKVAAALRARAAKDHPHVEE